VDAAGRTAGILGAERETYAYVLRKAVVLPGGTETVAVSADA
jgi:hypothetical protein